MMGLLLLLKQIQIVQQRLIRGKGTQQLIQLRRLGLDRCHWIIERLLARSRKLLLVLLLMHLVRLVSSKLHWRLIPLRLRLGRINCLLLEVFKWHISLSSQRQELGHLVCWISCLSLLFLIRHAHDSLANTQLEKLYMNGVEGIRNDATKPKNDRAARHNKTNLEIGQTVEKRPAKPPSCPFPLFSPKTRPQQLPFDETASLWPQYHLDMIKR